MSVRAKKHRLPVGEYEGRNVVFTIRVKEDKHAFAIPWVVEEHLEVLKASACALKCTVPLYCFMPEHAHVIVSGKAQGGNPLLAMNRYKILIGKWHAKAAPEFRIQRSFYDHIVRGPQDWREQVLYIVRNPVRAGFCQSWQEHPYTGSLSCDLSALLWEATWSDNPRENM